MIKRIVTASVVVPLIVWLVLKLSPFMFLLCSALVIVIALGEWGRMLKLHCNACLLMYVVTTLVLGLVGWFYLSHSTKLVLVTTFSLFWIFATTIVFMHERKIASKLFDTHFFWLIIGSVVVTLFWWSLLLLHQLNPFHVIFLLCLIWFADSIAYFTGRKLGKRKLVPRTSPGKSWEGAVAAVVLAPIIMLFANTLFSYDHTTHVSNFTFILSLLFLVVMSIVGDLFESVIKRLADVKDSGKLFPGHGGVLDRLDSMFSTMPVACALMYIQGSYF